MKKFTFVFLLFISNLLISQNQKKELFVKYTENEIIIDGILDESDWQDADGSSGFYEYFPNYGAKSINPAEIKIMNDKTNLYVGIKVVADPDDLKVNSLKRDFQAPSSDNITLIFDTFNDATNAFIIGSNHLGVQRDALLFNGGVDIMNSWDLTWDTKWLCESKIHDEYYITEWKIPLSAFKYREGETKWRVGCYQRTTKNSSWNMWHKVPKNQEFSNLTFMGDMYFEKPLSKSSQKKTVIPYINTLNFNDSENSIAGNDFEFGLDSKLTLDNSLTLDLTVNPDFSQVEVDEQITNLTRYEVSLPEKRQFFIENGDLFAGFGSRRDANPFFSRRIGIAEDINGSNIQNKIIAGLRLSGKINRNFRIGLLNMVTDEDIENEIGSNNNTIIALQHKVFSQSNISFMFINRENIKEYDFIIEEEKYNRVLGVDYNLSSNNSKWTGKYYLHKSITPGINRNDISTGIRTNYNSRNLSFRASGGYIGENFNSDLGFIRRKGIIKINPEIRYTFWPKDKKLVNHSFEITPIMTWDYESNNKLSDYFVFSRWEGTLQNGSSLNLSIRNQYTYLFENFDPTGLDNGNHLPSDSEYYYTHYEAEFNNYFSSNEFTYRIEYSFGEFFNGNKDSYDVSLSYRIQPKFTSTIKINYDKIRLPKPFNSENIILIAPRFEYTFTKKLFLSTLIQYSSQRENLSFNSRLQWRFAPLSDLFLVYNDNYYTENRYNSIFIPRVKNRSINLKLTYWLDI